MPISTKAAIPSETTPAPVQAWIGERIKMWRRNVGYTQTDLAHMLGVDKGTLRKYELGMMAPGALVLARACSHGVNINWVLTGELPMMKGRTFACELPESEDQLIVQLRDSLCILRALDPVKFSLLANGFTARAQEAAHMAELERLVSSVPADLPPVVGNEDIIAYGAQVSQSPPSKPGKDVLDSHSANGSESNAI